MSSNTPYNEQRAKLFAIVAGLLLLSLFILPLNQGVIKPENDNDYGQKSSYLRVTSVFLRATLLIANGFKKCVDARLKLRSKTNHASCTKQRTEYHSVPQ
jgi:hypothetical protein